MRSNRIVSLAWLCTVVVTLAGCPKKEEATPDAAPIAPAETVTAPVAEALPNDNDETETPSAATNPPEKTAAPAQKAAEKTTEAADTKAATDAKAAADTKETADAGAVQTCCCEVDGKLQASVEQSECVKAKKGQCVKKARCTEAEAAAKAEAEKAEAATKTAAQTCCCESDGKKSVVGQSECTKGGKGKCIKMAECKK